MAVKTPRARRITVEWRNLADKKMVELGIHRAELARRVKCSRPTIGAILDGDTAESDLVDPINKVLGIVVPQIEWDKLREWAEDADMLDDLLAWAKIGRRYAELDPVALKQAIDLARERVSGREEQEASREISKPPRSRANPDEADEDIRRR